MKYFKWFLLIIAASATEMAIWMNAEWLSAEMISLNYYFVGSLVIILMIFALSDSPSRKQYKLILGLTITAFAILTTGALKNFDFLREENALLPMLVNLVAYLIFAFLIMMKLRKKTN
ncbi:hypothetical protein GLW07_08860 [Bacillus hwajinpoensis]|uniref:Uncharacterized protein n=1 Tax=Guptibacillus hwajinpoensis TaxID=208199 RepID=A0A845EXZ6_9BACL|nr:hypothetical protein [Pseudalkalibacillus hwajinpoensis]MYL63462.1 hypothetical protein [Pseudalkalibacillus hwajinpoensis]